MMPSITSSQLSSLAISAATWPEDITPSAGLPSTIDFCSKMGAFDAITVCATVLLLLRALWLLGPAAPALRAPLLGALEAALGAVFVLATALG